MATKPKSVVARIALAVENLGPFATANQLKARLRKNGTATHASDGSPYRSIDVMLSQRKRFVITSVLGAKALPRGKGRPSAAALGKLQARYDRKVAKLAAVPA